jgi:uncharacterized membrane protein HdeD (DUF308 family)
MVSLAQYWWAFVLRGIFALLFAIGAWGYPGLTLWLLIVFFGVYVLVDGITQIGVAFSEKRWSYILAGLVGVAAGLLTFLWPGVTGFVLLLFIGFWALVKGILEIIAAIQLRKVIEGESFMILSGLASVLFAVIVLFRPGVGALAIAWIIGVYAFLFGLLSIFLGLKLKGLKQSVEGAAG